jgi:hypothetical protein
MPSWEQKHGSWHENGESIYDHRFKLQMLLIQRSKQIPSVIFPRFQTDFQVLSSK